MSSDGGKRSVSEQEQGEPVLWAAKESMFMWGKSDESGHPYHIVCKGKKVKSHQIPLYTTPQQRKPLTFEQVEDCFCEGATAEENGILVSAQWLLDFARAIEAAHSIKE